MKFKKRAGLTFVMILVSLVVLTPITLVVIQKVRQSIKSSVLQSNKQAALQFALNGLKDYFRQMSNNLYASLKPEDMVRPLINTLGEGSYKVNHTYNDSNNTLKLEIIGAFGLDPAAPAASQKISALIKFEPYAAQFMTAMASIDTWGITASNVTYEGPVYANNFKVEGTNVWFNGGPVVAKYKFENIPGSQPNPFIKGDLFYGTTKSLNGATVTGKMVNNVPEFPDFFIDFETFETIASNPTKGKIFTSDICIKFLGDGTYVTTTDLNHYITDLTNWPAFSGVTPVWSAPIAIPGNSFVIMAKGCNIGVAGLVKPKVTVVAVGASKSRFQGNIVVYDPIAYEGGATKSKKTSALALYAFNTIFVKDKDFPGNPAMAGDMTASGIFYIADGKKEPGAKFDADDFNIMYVYGPVDKTWTFTGTRNALFRQRDNSYNLGRTYKTDPGLIENGTPGPTIIRLVSLDIR